MQTMTSDIASEPSRWHQIAARDRSADAQFVYAVRSTGIYCRPSCPSRKPRPDRVVYFEQPADAERAGYRACRRCQPGQPPRPDPWAEKIRRACLYLANAGETPSLARLAARIGGSPYHVQRNFTRIVGVTPREYAEACRLQKVRLGLRRSSDITRAVVDAGYGSSSRFYERDARRLGMSPTAYRAGGVGTTIRFTTVGSPLGRLLVGATSRGVCMVALGATDRELERRLRHEYPAAELVPDRDKIARWTTAILDQIRGRQPRLDLPVDVRATAFQWQVWTALMAIPRGETRSYADIAAAIGRPRSARAVARACSANPVALVIPCHRVIPAGRGTGGYRWGAARKKALLARERAG